MIAELDNLQASDARWVLAGVAAGESFSQATFGLDRLPRRVLGQVRMLHGREAVLAECERIVRGDRVSRLLALREVLDAAWRRAWVRYDTERYEALQERSRAVSRAIRVTVEAKRG